nr:hypothetical protein [Tanacetum cinerariifolium]
ALPCDTVKNAKLNVNSTSLVLSAYSYPTDELKGESNLENSNAAERKEEQRGTPQSELKDPNDIEKIGPSRDDNEREIKWLDVEEPLDLFNLIFWQPFVEITCLAKNKKHELMTFMDGTKEITFKTPYKDPERSKLSSEGHDLLSSRIILSEDDYDIGYRKPIDLEDGFYRDTIKLGPEYVTGWMMKEKLRNSV